MSNEKNENVGLVPYDYGQDAGSGFEGQTQEDLSIPFLTVLQALSPQVVDNQPEGARAGMLFNTVTQELHDGKEGLLFVPCMTQHVFVEWIPRKKGGGFVGVHDLASPVVARAREKSTEFGKFWTYDEAGNEDNQLVETFYVFGVMTGTDPANATELSPVILAFTSTKIKVYKGWSTLVNKRKDRAPLFAFLVHLGSVSQENASGKFFNFSLRNVSMLAPDDARYTAAKGLKALIGSGRAKAAYESQTTEGGESEAAGKDGKPPF